MRTRFGLPDDDEPSAHHTVLPIGDLVRCLEVHRTRWCSSRPRRNEFKPLLRQMCSQWKYTCSWWTVQAAEDAHAAISSGPASNGDEDGDEPVAASPPTTGRYVAADDGGHFLALAAVNEAVAWLARRWHLLTRTAAYGDPLALATAEKGERFMSASTDKLADFIVELSRRGDDETFPY